MEQKDYEGVKIRSAGLRKRIERSSIFRIRITKKVKTVYLDDKAIRE